MMSAKLLQASPRELGIRMTSDAERDRAAVSGFRRLPSGCPDAFPTIGRDQILCSARVCPQHGPNALSSRDRAPDATVAYDPNGPRTRWIEDCARRTM